MSNEVLFKLAVVASTVLVTLTAAVAQQSGSGLQPQLVPTTPGGTPPAEITPSHPLDSTTGPRTGTSTGAAPTQVPSIKTEPTPADKKQVRTGSAQRRGSNQISGGAGSSQGQRPWPQGENEAYTSAIILTNASWPIRRDATSGAVSIVTKD